MVRRLSLSSFLVSFVVSFSVWDLLSLYFGSWKHLVPFVALILVLLWSWGELGLSDPGLDLPDTCMSDQSSQAIQDLTAAVQALTLAISGQASTPPSESRSETSAGDWEVVGSDAQDIRISRDFECSRVSHRGAEEGPGEIPPILLDIARSKLSSKPPGAEFRALRAFRAGFWARIAQTPYCSRAQPSVVLPGSIPVLTLDVPSKVTSGIHTHNKYMGIYLHIYIYVLVYIYIYTYLHIQHSLIQIDLID